MILLNKKLKNIANLIILGLIILFSSCSFPESGPVGTALIYGIGEYKNIKVPDLKNTVSDANSIYDIFNKAAWKLTIRTTNANFSEETNMLASKAGILSDIASLKGTKGLVLFYYSGHGISGNGNICPYDAIPNPMTNTISYDELFDAFKNAELENVILIMDSCFSGNFVNDGNTMTTLPDDYAGSLENYLFTQIIGKSIISYAEYCESTNVICISAAGANEESYEQSALGHGIFTYYFCKGFDNGNADYDKDGYITTSESYIYSLIAINNYWNRIYPEENNFIPHLSGSPSEIAFYKVD